MTSENKLQIRKFSLTILIFFFLFLLLAGTAYLTDGPADVGIKTAADLVLKKWNASAPQTGEPVTIAGVGWNYTKAYQALVRGKESGLVFVVRLTGNSGPNMAIFYYAPANGTTFCGLAGVSGTTESCGITESTIRHWTRRLTSIGEKAENKK